MSIIIALPNAELTLEIDVTNNCDSPGPMTFNVIDPSGTTIVTNQLYTAPSVTFIVNDPGIHTIEINNSCGGCITRRTFDVSDCPIDAVDFSLLISDDGGITYVDEIDLNVQDDVYLNCDDDTIDSVLKIKNVATSCITPTTYSAKLSDGITDVDLNTHLVGNDIEYSAVFDGDYTVTVTDECGCSGSMSFSVRRCHVVTSTLINGPDTVCPLSTFRLSTPRSTDEANTSRVWNLPVGATQIDIETNGLWIDVQEPLNPVGDRTYEVITTWDNGVDVGCSCSTLYTAIPNEANLDVSYLDPVISCAEDGQIKVIGGVNIVCNDCCNSNNDDLLNLQIDSTLQVIGGSSFAGDPIVISNCDSTGQSVTIEWIGDAVDNDTVRIDYEVNPLTSTTQCNYNVSTLDGIVYSSEVDVNQAVSLDAIKVDGVVVGNTFYVDEGEEAQVEFTFEATTECSKFDTLTVGTGVLELNTDDNPIVIEDQLIVGIEDIKITDECGCFVEDTITIMECNTVIDYTCNKSNCIYCTNDSAEITINNPGVTIDFVNGIAPIDLPDISIDHGTNIISFTTLGDIPVTTFDIEIVDPAKNNCKVVETITIYNVLEPQLVIGTLDERHCGDVCDSTVPNTLTAITDFDLLPVSPFYSWSLGVIVSSDVDNVVTVTDWGDVSSVDVDHCVTRTVSLGVYGCNFTWDIDIENCCVLDSEPTCGCIDSNCTDDRLICGDPCPNRDAPICNKCTESNTCVPTFDCNPPEGTYREVTGDCSTCYGNISKPETYHTGVDDDCNCVCEDLRTDLEVCSNYTNQSGELLECGNAVDYCGNPRVCEGNDDFPSTYGCLTDGCCDCVDLRCVDNNSTCHTLECINCVCQCDISLVQNESELSPCTGEEFTIKVTTNLEDPSTLEWYDGLTLFDSGPEITILAGGSGIKTYTVQDPDGVCSLDVEVNVKGQSEISVDMTPEFICTGGEYNLALLFTPNCASCCEDSEFNLTINSEVYHDGDLIDAKETIVPSTAEKCSDSQNNPVIFPQSYRDSIDGLFTPGMELDISYVITGVDQIDGTCEIQNKGIVYPLTVTVPDENCCSIEPGYIDFVCPGEDITLTANYSSPTDNTTTTWYFVEGEIETLLGTGVSYTILDIDPDQFGTYKAVSNQSATFCSATYQILQAGGCCSTEISLDPNKTICPGSNDNMILSTVNSNDTTYIHNWLIIQGSSKASFHPQFPIGASNTNTPTLYVNDALITDIIRIRVTVTDPDGCSSFTEFQIPINTNICSCQDPAVNVGLTANTNNVCQGEPVVLSALTSGGTGPYYYRWTHNPGLTTVSTIVYPTSTTTYGVTVTDSNGCSAYNSVRVDVTGGGNPCCGQPEGTPCGQCGQCDDNFTCQPIDTSICGSGKFFDEQCAECTMQPSGTYECSCNDDIINNGCKQCNSECNALNLPDNQVCAAGKVCCNGECVDLQTDMNNCGSCGTVCSDECVAGECCDIPSLVITGGNFCTGVGSVQLCVEDLGGFFSPWRYEWHRDGDLGFSGGSACVIVTEPGVYRVEAYKAFTFGGCDPGILYSEPFVISGETCDCGPGEICSQADDGGCECCTPDDPCNVNSCGDLSDGCGGQVDCGNCDHLKAPSASNCAYCDDEGVCHTGCPNPKDECCNNECIDTSSGCVKCVSNEIVSTCDECSRCVSNSCQPLSNSSCTTCSSGNCVCDNGDCIDIVVDCSLYISPQLNVTLAQEGCYISNVTAPNSDWSVVSYDSGSGNVCNDHDVNIIHNSSGCTRTITLSPECEGGTLGGSACDSCCEQEPCDCENHDWFSTSLDREGCSVTYSYSGDNLNCDWSGPGLLNVSGCTATVQCGEDWGVILSAPGDCLCISSYRQIPCLPGCGA